MINIPETYTDDITTDLELFMMVICHQPYSELKNIVPMKMFKYQQRFFEIINKLIGQFGDFMPQEIKDKLESTQKEMGYIPPQQPLSEWKSE